MWAGMVTSKSSTGKLKNNSQDSHPESPPVQPASRESELHLAKLCERLHLQLATIERARWAEVSANQARIDHLVATRDQLAARKDNIIAAKDHELGLLREQIADRDRAIREILDSTAWKLSWPYRSLGTSAIKTFKAFIFMVKAPHKAATALMGFAGRFIKNSSPLIKNSDATRKPLSPEVGAKPSEAPQTGIVKAYAETRQGLGGEWQWIYDQIRR